MRNRVTLSLLGDMLRWERKKAIDEKISLSSLFIRMLSDERSRSDRYWKAFEDWKEMGPVPGVNANRRLTSEEAHARRQ